MAAAFNLAPTPVRLLFALALLLLAALLVGFSVNQPPIQNAGSHSQPPSMFATEPHPGSHPAAARATPATTRIVTGSTQGPSVSAPAAAAEPVQPAPAVPA